MEPPQATRLAVPNSSEMENPIGINIRIKALALLLVTLATLVPLAAISSSEAEAASGCKTLTTTQNGIGGVTGSVLARHVQTSQWCYSGTDAYSGGITVHTADAVGWTQLLLTVSKDGSSEVKVGTSRVHTTYAKAKVCLTGPLNIVCSTKNANIKQTLKKDGSWSRTSSSWNL